MDQMYQDCVRFFSHMGFWQYVTLLTVVLGVGLVCMKGFGSRNGY